MNIWHDKTIILLTHQLNFLEKMDKIIVMNHNKVVEQGNLRSLLTNKKGLFYELYKNIYQLKNYIVFFSY